MSDSLVFLKWSRRSSTIWFVFQGPKGDPGPTGEPGRAGDPVSSYLFTVTPRTYALSKLRNDVLAGPTWCCWCPRHSGSSWRCSRSSKRTNKCLTKGAGIINIYIYIFFFPSRAYPESSGHRVQLDREETRWVTWLLCDSQWPCMSSNPPAVAEKSGFLSTLLNAAEFLPNPLMLSYKCWGRIRASTHSLAPFMSLFQIYTKQQSSKWAKFAKIHTANAAFYVCVSAFPAVMLL